MENGLVLARCLQCPRNPSTGVAGKLRVVAGQGGVVYECGGWYDNRSGKRYQCPYQTSNPNRYTDGTQWKWG